MQTKTKRRTQESLKILTSLAMLIAVSIICGKYLAIRGGDILRFSFENLPIIFAGIAFGPVSGAAVGIIADLIGCVLVGYAINPIVTVGAAAIGLVSGLCELLLKRVKKMRRAVSVSISVAAAHIIGSVLIKTFGLAVFYDMPIMVLMLWRLLNYLIIGIIEGFLLICLLKNKQLAKVINKMKSEVIGKSNFTKYANSFQAVTIPGLERIGALCEKFENPQENLKFIHIAGTNGKGSVSANLACILEDSGYKVGKYISPNLIKVNERISINGTDISDADLNALLLEIEPRAKEVEKELGLAPTQFEIWTALAFIYFKRKACDYVVLEVGLGGEFDATNIITKNEIAIITRLGLDHMQYLGNTIADVARAKSGIMKHLSGTGAVVTVNQGEEAMSVINERAASLGLCVDIPNAIHEETNGIFESFSLGKIKGIKCGIAGYHQIENASLAALAAIKLGVCEAAIKSGISRAKNPARFELLCDEPPIIYDGGHNENGIEALNSSLERYFRGMPRTVVFACMSDKEIKDSLALLSVGSTEFIFTTVKDNPRAATAKELKARAEGYGYSGEAREDIGEAYELAKSRGKLTVICGSLYLYKDLNEYLNKKEGK